MIAISRRIPTLKIHFASFSKRKQTNKEDLQRDSSRQQTVQIQEKYRQKSAALFGQYMQERERAALTLDNYQIHYTLILERPPIFVPYHEKKFGYYKRKYNFLKNTGYYSEIPKDLQMESGDYLFGEYERINPENQTTHRHEVSKAEVHEYAANSRYWKYTDPNIEDPSSIQAYSSDNVFFITKGMDGEWKFPSKTIVEKDKHKQVFILLIEELFGGSASPLVYFTQKRPAYIRRVEDESKKRGQGFYEFFYKGLSLNGMPSFPTNNFREYAWVPKPKLEQYFKQEYFKEVAPLTLHLC